MRWKQTWCGHPVVARWPTNVLGVPNVRTWDFKESWGVKKCAIAWTFPKGARRILVSLFRAQFRAVVFEVCWETVKGWKA